MWSGYGTIHFLTHFTHALSTKHDGIYIPVTTPPIKKLLWSPPHLPPQPCHTPETLSSNATLIVRASIATAKTMQKIGWCVFTHSLVHFWLLCCPLSHEPVLSPQPRDTLRVHHCPPLAAKSAKTEAMVSFFNLSFIPPTSNISPFNFLIKLLLPDEPSHSLLQPCYTLPLFNSPAMPLRVGNGKFVCGF
jgi:hypothetical protein